MLSNVESRSDAPCSIMHDVQAHSSLLHLRGRETDSIIFNGQNQALLGHLQTDQHLAGFAMFDRIVDGLLGDPIKMAGLITVRNTKRFRAKKNAADAKEFFNVRA